MKELTVFLKELGNPSIEEVHNDHADALKYLSDNFGETAMSEKSVCMVKSEKLLETLDALTLATVWLKVNRENFRE